MGVKHKGFQPPKPSMNLVIHPPRFPHQIKPILPALQSKSNRPVRNIAPPSNNLETRRPWGAYQAKRQTENPSLPTAPLRPEDIINSYEYSSLLTPQDKIEIQFIKDIYYIRQKRPNTNETNQNCAFFNFVKNDHINFRYQQLTKLGKGSFGIVIKCFDHKLQKNVAVKLVRDTPDMHKQILLEKELLTLLHQNPTVSTQHHLIQVLDVFAMEIHGINEEETELSVESTFYAFVFELLGTDLDKSIRNKANLTDISKLQLVARQIVDSISYLHSLGYTHCDIKPENILWTSTRKTAIKLIDFGCCCHHDATIFEYIQSRYYRAPEVIFGLSYSHEIDVWSFGCLLAELYTGKTLFKGENEQEMVQMFMSVLGEPPYSFYQNGTQSKYYFDDEHQPIIKPNSKGVVHGIRTTTFSELLNLQNNDQQLRGLIDVLELCLKWIPSERITMKDLMNNPWINRIRVKPPSTAPYTSRPRIGRTRTNITASNKRKVIKTNK